ncbi:MAG: TIGR04282 family arsenosugar biosynthesis glycosyltransferase [Gammaproteobacteria bacterium]|nr:TIGR04282 family arsenosugar biosynthesis glycosyltransferase [Gammaproteobacteria bacterium]MDH5652737.1 TIGR04282 family arsenosugar biosynthesis glycosyltransferase [Gammaproteobacteria bacterium]
MADRVPYPNARLIIFSRAPQPGHCKTRIAATIGDAAAADLQAQLLTEKAAMACTAPLCPIELWCAPDCRHPLFQSLAAEYPLTLHQQAGADLGERMYHAMSATPAEYTIIIGTDCPLLDRPYIKTALQMLAEGSEMVIGPAEDGGYVLLGLRHIEPTLFRDVEWGTARVLAQTLNAADRAGLSVRQLAMLWDLDRPEDLSRYQVVHTATVKQ